LKPGKKYNRASGFVWCTLFWAVLAFVIYQLVSPSAFFSGQPVVRLQLVIIDKPVFVSGAPDLPSFYQFTARNYKCNFRISDGALELVKKDSGTRQQLERLKLYDTVSILIKKSEEDNLQNDEKHVHLVGLDIGNQILIDPAKVASVERSSRYLNIIVIALLSVVLIIRLTRKWLRQRKSIDLPESKEPAGDT
jgi:hypothetical protein